MTRIAQPLRQLCHTCNGTGINKKETYAKRKRCKYYTGTIRCFTCDGVGTLRTGVVYDRS